MIIPDKPLVFTRKQTAALLSMGLRTLDAALANGTIGCVRIGGKVVFRQCDIDSFLARHAVAPRELAGAI